MAVLAYDRFNDARAHLKDLLDASQEGRSAVVRRRGHTTALVDRARLIHALQIMSASRFCLQPDEDRWLAAITGAPLAGEGDDPDEAVWDLIDALRDYADDWAERLRHAPNHADNWGLVQLTDLSDDDELHDWITGVGPGR